MMFRIHYFTNTASRAVVVKRYGARFISFLKMKETFRRLLGMNSNELPYTHICQVGDPVLRGRAIKIEPEVVRMADFQKEEKREIPLLLRKFLAIDAYLTNVFVNWAEQVLFFRRLKAYHKVIDISCYSIIWLVTNLMLIWIFNNSNLYQMQVNLLIGLMLDIILVVVLKAISRRRRPTTNHSFASEKDSFPSGHSTHATFITYFFLNLWPVPLICIAFLLAWSFLVCMSRLLVRKNHIVDVLAGIALGIFQGLLIEYIYLEQETCASLVWWITDEKISGAEYDV